MKGEYTNYLEPKWGPGCFDWNFGLVLGGLTFKNRGHWGSRYTNDESWFGTNTSISWWFFKPICYQVWVWWLKSIYSEYLRRFSPPERKNVNGCTLQKLPEIPIFFAQNDLWLRLLWNVTKFGMIPHPVEVLQVKLNRDPPNNPVVHWERGIALWDEPWREKCIPYRTWEFLLAAPLPTKSNCTSPMTTQAVMVACISAWIRERKAQKGPSHAVDGRSPATGNLLKWDL